MCSDPRGVEPVGEGRHVRQLDALALPVRTARRHLDDTGGSLEPQGRLGLAHLDHPRLEQHRREADRVRAGHRGYSVGSMMMNPRRSRRVGRERRGSRGRRRCRAARAAGASAASRRRGAPASSRRPVTVVGSRTPPTTTFLEFAARAAADDGDHTAPGHRRTPHHRPCAAVRQQAVRRFRSSLSVAVTLGWIRAHPEPTMHSKRAPTAKAGRVAAGHGCRYWRTPRRVRGAAASGLRRKRVGVREPSRSGCHGSL